MQITLDLPDDLYIEAQAVAKRESRSLGSVLTDLIRSMKTAPLPAFMSKPAPGHRFPVIAGKPVTQAELDRILEEDGLP